MPTITQPQYAPVGSLVLSGYWREQYRVLAHNSDGSVTVRWETGPSATQTGTHHTPMDWKRDRILGNAEVVDCRQCNDTATCEAHTGCKVKCARCMSTGAFITFVENGVPKGPGGKCFRCNGKGHHTDVDRKRNYGYDCFGRRY